MEGKRDEWRLGMFHANLLPWVTAKASALRAGGCWAPALPVTQQNICAGSCGLHLWGSNSGGTKARVSPSRNIYILAFHSGLHVPATSQGRSLAFCSPQTMADGAEDTVSLLWWWFQSCCPISVPYAAPGQCCHSRVVCRKIHLWGAGCSSGDCWVWPLLPHRASESKLLWRGPTDSFSLPNKQVHN